MSELRDAYWLEISHYRRARAGGEAVMAWRGLERAHILSQPRLMLHLHSHAAMLGFALAQRDFSEAAGQLFRLVLAPVGTLAGRIPLGNTGRANVSAFQPMPVPDDLRPLVEGKGQRKPQRQG